MNDLLFSETLRHPPVLSRLDFSDITPIGMAGGPALGATMRSRRQEETIIALEDEMLGLHAPEIERLDTVADDAGLREIFVICNRVNDQVRAAIVQIYAKYLRRYPQTIGELHIWDRRDRPINEYAPVDFSLDVASYRMLR